MQYKKPSVTVDMAICTIIDDELSILLIKRKHPPYKNSWAIPGGFVNIDEALDDAAYRELLEETALRSLRSKQDGPGPRWDIFLEQLKTYGDIGRDPRGRVISVAYYALIPYNDGLLSAVEARDDAKEARWFPLRKLPNLAFDHDQILTDLKERIKGKTLYSPIAFSLLPKKFTWAELQKVYGILTEKTFFPKNFRARILSQYDLKVFHFHQVGHQSKTGRPPVYLRLEGVKTF